MLHERKVPKEVAELLSVSQRTVYDWHHRWQAQGVEGLANRPKSGRRVKATGETEIYHPATAEGKRSEYPYKYCETVS